MHRQRDGGHRTDRKGYRQPPEANVTHCLARRDAPLRRRRFRGVSALPARRPGTGQDPPGGGAGRWHGSEWSRPARMAASTSSACRQPTAATSQALSGINAKLAHAPKKVSTVSARPRQRRNQTATMAKAGSYSTIADTTPIPAMMAYKDHSAATWDQATSSRLASDRASRHQRPRAVAIEPAPDRHGGQPGAQQAARRHRERRGRPRQLGRHRRDKHGERVIQDAPRDQLGHRHGAEHDPAVIHAPAAAETSRQGALAARWPPQVGRPVASPVHAVLAY